MFASISDGIKTKRLNVDMIQISRNSNRRSEDEESCYSHLCNPTLAKVKLCVVLL